MKVKSITLRNFRNARNETLEPPVGESFILTGDNGAGKSSFLWAIAFCFYGYADWTLESTPTRGTESGRVSVAFKKDGNYEAVREFTKKSTNFTFYEDGTPVVDSTNNKDHEEAFKKVFPVNKEAFLHLVCKVQTEDHRYSLGSFCRSTSKGMYDIIKNFIDVIKFEKYEKKNKEIMDTLSNNKIELESSIKIYKEMISKVEDEIKGVDKEKIDKKLNKMQKYKEKYEEKVDEWTDKIHQQEEYEKAQKTIKKYEGIKENAEEWDKIKYIKDPGVEFKDNISKLEKKLKKNRNQKENLEEKLDGLGEKSSKVEEKIDKLEEDNKKIEIKNNKIENEIANFKKKIDLVESGQCPKCGREFEDPEEEKEHYQEKIDELKNDIKELKELPTEKLDEIENEINDVESGIELTEESIENIEDQLEEQNQAKEFQKVKEFKEDYSYDAPPEKALARYEDALEKEKPEGEVPDKEKVKKVKKKLKTANDEIPDLKSKADAYEKNEKDLKENKKKLKQAKKDLKETKEEYIRHNELSDIYSRTGAPHFMIQEFLDQLEYNANKYLRDFADGRFSVEFVTDYQSSSPLNMRFYDLKFGKKQPMPFSSFSKGERTRIALAVEFLGFRKTFAELSSIEIESGFIDEVYGLDEEGQKRFAEVLSEISNVVPVIGGVACFGEHNFENVFFIENGQIVDRT